MSHCCRLVLVKIRSEEFEWGHFDWALNTSLLTFLSLAASCFSWPLSCVQVRNWAGRAEELWLHALMVMASWVDTLTRPQDSQGFNWGILHERPESQRSARGDPNWKLLIMVRGSIHQRVKLIMNNHQGTQRSGRPFIIALGIRYFLHRWWRRLSGGLTTNFFSLLMIPLSPPPGVDDNFYIYLCEVHLLFVTLALLSGSLVTCSPALGSAN